jgi:biotin transport system substrate-specific component
MLAAVLCIASPFAIPLGPVPLSLSILAVLLCARIGGAFCSCAAVLLYLVLGCVGLPVFGGGMAGIGVLLGPTGGYLWSYLPMCVLTGLLYTFSERKKLPFGKRMMWELLAGLCGLLICYFCGTLQYALIANVPFLAAISVCVLPFVLFDLGKLLLAFLLSDRFLRITQIRRMLDFYVK